MDSQEFIEECKNVANFVTEYLDGLGQEKVSGWVTPGYLRPLLERTIPDQGEPFAKVMKDLKRAILPGMVHWAHPHFHAYLPSSHAYPSILAEMYASGLGVLGFTWIAGPSVVELEVVMTDWLCRALGLPAIFLNSDTTTRGGGIMASSASECALTTVLAARLQAVNRLKDTTSLKPIQEDAQYLQHLVAYCSQETHSCMEKAAKVAMIKLRVLETNSEQQLKPETLKDAMDRDIARGLHPCYVMLTVGTSSSGAYDDIKKLATVVREYPDVWIHVNAAYGGNNWICPELRTTMAGIELVDSVCVNPYKGLLINVDSTTLWVRDRVAYCSALIVDPIYLAHNLSDQFLDHRHWSLWLTRRFRSLKIWFTFRLYGVEGLRSHVRNMLKMAVAFSEMVRSHPRFELCSKVNMPLVCFRLRGPDGLNHELLAMVNGKNKMLMTPAVLGGRFVLRLVVGYEGTSLGMMEDAWEEIRDAAEDLLDGVPDLAPENIFRKLSFTRRVSFMDYRMRHPKLMLGDMEKPVLVPYANPDDVLKKEEDK